MGDFIRGVIIVKLGRSARKIFADLADVRTCCWLKKRGCWGDVVALVQPRREGTVGREFSVGVGEGRAHVRVSGAKRGNLGIRKNKKSR